MGVIQTKFQRLLMLLEEDVVLAAGGMISCSLFERSCFINAYSGYYF
jgi:hypothetical protein